MSVTGTWNMTLKTPMGERPSLLTLVEENGVLTGTMEGEGATSELLEGKFDGSKISWKNKVSRPMPMTLTFKGALDGASLSGDVKVGVMGTFSWVAEKAA